MIKKVDVIYEGWGERWHLATLADDGRKLLFEYSAEALAQGLELSPRHVKLRTAAYADFPSYLLGLPGLVADALPDGWGAILKQLALMGGSPHGARPKVLVHYHAADGQMSTQPFDGSAPWLVKFQAQNEHKEVCAIEHLYAQLARACGLDMPATEYFHLSPQLAAFGIARFDVAGTMRIPDALGGAGHRTATRCGRQLC